MSFATTKKRRFVLLCVQRLLWTHFVITSRFKHIRLHFRTRLRVHKRLGIRSRIHMRIRIPVIITHVRICIHIRI